MHLISRWVVAAIVLMSAAVATPRIHAAAPVKVYLCTGDYGMWAQDRVALIIEAVAKASPGLAVFDSDQSYNFVKKLERPGYAQRYDVIAIGDVALGQMTTAAQQALVAFVEQGGGLIYVVHAKSTIGFHGPAAAEPMPLASILPYQFPAHDPVNDTRADATAIGLDAPLLEGLNFAATPWQANLKTKDKPLVLIRPHGKGEVMALYGAFSASYKRISYATFETAPGGWDQWPDLGKLWARLLRHAASHSPILGLTPDQVAATVRSVPLTVQVNIDAREELDDIRAANFSIVALKQLYKEDKGRLEHLMLSLNPLDWFDRLSEQVLPNTDGKQYPDKTVLFSEYRIQGILMDDNSYGSYRGWDEADWEKHVADDVAAARKWPQFLTYFQPGNEPPFNSQYFMFHNRISKAVLAQAPHLKVIGPNAAFNMHGPNEKQMKAYLEACGAYTDVLNWHIYGRCPESVRDQVLYWTQYAEGKLRSDGPARVMFTEADTWNTGDSQFNYLMTRAFTFLPMKQIVACFQYCMDPRSEGGTYRFGVLQPEGEFEANYNGYWIWRNLRGRMVAVTKDASIADANEHCHVLASSLDGGRSITAVVYYDAGFYDGPEGKQAAEASVTLHVRLPPGRYTLERSDANWNSRTATSIPTVVRDDVTVDVTLKPFHAAAFTWTRQ